MKKRAMPGAHVKILMRDFKSLGKHINQRLVKTVDFTAKVCDVIHDQKIQRNLGSIHTAPSTSPWCAK
ncbi:hypothetical protein [Acidithiobacillus sp.]|uniref:hypothetical protein n=1 Tax=Acidithiobacillus sp. TaxID=1872118 RepID=UPI003D069CC9